MTFPSHALIGLGSNLGDRQALLLEALDRIDRSEQISVESRSEFIETSPVGGPPQGPYFNGAACLATGLTARGLLEELLAVEATLGRVRTIPLGPRTVDLDLLLFDREVISTPELTLPHPRLHLRSFVLVPAAQIAPDFRHPVLDRTVAELLAALKIPSNEEVS